MARANPDRHRPDPCRTGDRSDPVPARLQALERMDRAALQSEWQRLWRVPPPRYMGRELLKLGVAWKLQEQAYGGHSAATRRRLTELQKLLARDGDVARDSAPRLRPGARLVRSWRGQDHIVIVTQSGFEWRGRHWRSLTAIARAITGAAWSGPRFFGLTGQPTGKAEPGKRRDA